MSILVWKLIGHTIFLYVLNFHVLLELLLSHIGFLCLNIIMSMLNIIFLNCRDTSSVNTINRVHKLIMKHKLCLLRLVETKANEDMLMQFCKNFVATWEHSTILIECCSGGIITLRKQLITKYCNYSRLSLHLVISS